MEPVKNMENIELLVDSDARTRFVFADQPNLRCKKIKHIDVPSVSDVTVTPNGKAVVNATIYGKAFLVLCVAGSEQVNRIPLKSLNPYSNYGARISLSDLIVDWTKSYVEVGSTTGLVADEAFFLNVFF